MMMIKPRWIHQLIRAVAASLGLFFLISAAWPQDRAAALAAEPSFFDPDGYYYPASDLVVSGYKIDGIELRTLEYYFDDALHYENPRFMPQKARLRLTHIVKQERHSYDCPEPIIRQDRLAIVCQSTPIGVVSISGTFIDKRGQFWNKEDIIALKTIVVDGVISIGQDGHGAKPRQVSFTYWQGD